MTIRFGSEDQQASIRDITSAYKLQHNDLDTSFRMADFEKAIQEKLRETLQEENKENIKGGKGIKDTVSVNNFENDEITKFYKDEIGDLIGNVKNMNRRQLKTQQARMKNLLASVDKSQLKESEFIKAQLLKSQSFLDQEVKTQSSWTKRSKDAMDDALDKYVDIQSLAFGLVDNNPLASVAIKMAGNWYKRNKEQKKETAKMLEAQTHREQMAQYNEDEKSEQLKQQEKDHEELHKLQKDQSGTKESDLQSQNVIKKDEDNQPKENVAEEQQDKQIQKRSIKAEQKYYQQTSTWQNKNIKILSNTYKKVNLIEKHTKQSLKFQKRNGGNRGGMMGGKMGMGMMGAGLAVAGAGAVGYLIGEGINMAVEEVTGDTVGNNIYNVFNGSTKPEDLSKEEQKKHKDLRIDESAYDGMGTLKDKIEDTGAVDFNWFGESKIKDVDKLRALSKFELDLLYNHDDWSKEDKEKIEMMMIEKNKESDDRVKAIRKREQAKRDDRNNSSLGSVSEKYETGGRGVGTISSGRGDPGGVSYGSYQLASKTGTLQKYLEQSEFKDQLSGDINSEEFKANWKKLAKEEPEKFKMDQHDFIKKTHYDPVLAEYKKQSGMKGEIDSGLANALWSQSVQHSKRGNDKIIAESLKGLPEDATSEQRISALYGARSDYVSKLSMNPNTKNNVLTRYTNEEGDALALAGISGVGSTQDLIPTQPQSTELTAQIDSTKNEIDQKTKETSKQPIIVSQVANNTTNGGKSQIGNPIPSSARNTESSNQRITDRYISGGMV